MDKNALKQAQRELDRVLRETPERLRELYETVNYDAALKKLKEAGNPDPRWVETQTRTLRVKAATIQTAAGEMARSLEERLTHYIEAGGADSLRIAHAREALLTLRTAQENRAAQSEQLRQLAQSSAQLQEQAALLDDCELQQLRQKLRKQ